MDIIRRLVLFFGVVGFFTPCFAASLNVLNEQEFINALNDSNITKVIFDNNISLSSDISSITLNGQTINFSGFNLNGNEFRGFDLANGKSV